MQLRPLQGRSGTVSMASAYIVVHFRVCIEHLSCLDTGYVDNGTFNVIFKFMYNYEPQAN